MPGAGGMPGGMGGGMPNMAGGMNFGGMGGGHYTAYAQNPLDKEWYEFDDSSVSKVDKNQVVTRAAYNLFFRRRDWHEKNLKEGVDFEKLAQRPDMNFIQTVQK